MTGIKFLKLFILGSLMFTLLNSCDRDMDEDEVEPSSASQQGTITDGNDDELLDLDYDVECFEISFPIEIDYQDVGIELYNSEEELEDALEVWETQNPNAETYPSLIYPITVIHPDGTSQVFESEAEFIEALALCEEEDDDDEEEDEDHEDEDEEDDDDEDDDEEEDEEDDDDEDDDDDDDGN